MTHEDQITVHLVQSLIRTKLVPGRIIYQYALLAEDAGGNVSASSNIDFVLTVGDDEDVYLACECKRLNVPYKTGVRALVGEYVDEGLMQFVTGQYSRGLPFAMMLGYVMNAKTDMARRKKNYGASLDDHRTPVRTGCSECSRPARSFSYDTCLRSRACHRGGPYFVGVAIDRPHRTR